LPLVLPFFELASGPAQPLTAYRYTCFFRKCGASCLCIESTSRAGLPRLALSPCRFSSPNGSNYSLRRDFPHSGPVPIAGFSLRNRDRGLKRSALNYGSWVDPPPLFFCSGSMVRTVQSPSPMWDPVSPSPGCSLRSSRNLSIEPSQASCSRYPFLTRWVSTPIG